MEGFSIDGASGALKRRGRFLRPASSYRCVYGGRKAKTRLNREEYPGFRTQGDNKSFMFWLICAAMRYQPTRPVSSLAQGLGDSTVILCCDAASRGCAGIPLH